MQTIYKDIRKMVVFAQVVTDGSFTRAAKSLNLGKASVSEHVSQLEDELKVMLLNRSTRQISLTQAGEVFLEYCQEIISQAQAAHDDVSSMSKSPNGKVRVSTTVNFSVFQLTPILAEFKQRYPDIQIELVLDDKIVDLVAEQIDIAIRIGSPKDLPYRYRYLSKVKLVLVAGKNYIAKFGSPRKLSDLLQHQWISLTLQEASVKLSGYKEEVQEQVKLKPAYSSNSPMSSYAMVMTNLGIAMLPEFNVTQEIKNGSLVKVLDDYDFIEGEAFILYPNSLKVPVKSRVFIDYLVEKLKID